MQGQHSSAERGRRQIWFTCNIEHDAQIANAKTKMMHWEKQHLTQEEKDKQEKLFQKNIK